MAKKPQLSKLRTRLLSLVSVPTWQRYDSRRLEWRICSSSFSAGVLNKNLQRLVSLYERGYESRQ